MPEHPARKPAKTSAGKSLVWLLTIAAVAVAAYIPSLKGGFVLDDLLLIVKDPLAHSLKYSRLAFLTDFLHGFLGPDTAYYRPLITVSYQANYTLSGPNPLAFRLTNVILNAAVAVLVFVVARQLIKNTFAAGVAGLCFAVLPSHAESVAWISGRTDVIATLFMLGSLLAFAANLRPRPKFSWLLAALCSVLFLFALLSKESALVLPALFLVYAWAAERPVRKDEVWKWTVALLLSLVVYLAVRQSVVSSALAGHLGLKLKERLLCVGIAYAYYLRMLFVPRDIRVIYDAFAIGVKHPVIALAAWLFPIGLVAAAVWARKRCRMVSFAAAWVFISILPVTNLLPTIGPLPTERFVYLASVGSSIFLGWLALKLYTYRPQAIGTWPAIVTAVVCWFVIYSGLVAVQGSQHYLSNVAWARAVRSTDTRFAMLRATGAQFLAEAGFFEEAEGEYRKTLSLDPSHPVVWIELAQVERGLGKPAEAIELMEKACARFPGNPDVEYNLGIACAETGAMRNAASAFQSAVDIDPNHGPAWRGLARADLRLKRYPASVRAFTRAFSLIKPNLQDRFELGLAYKGVGDMEKARREFKLVVDQAPTSDLAKKASAELD